PCCRRPETRGRRTSSSPSGPARRQPAPGYGPPAPRRTALVGAGAFLVRGQLRGRNSFEPLVGDGHAALDGQAVGSGHQTILGALEGGELLAQILLAALVE